MAREARRPNPHHDQSTYEIFTNPLSESEVVGTPPIAMVLCLSRGAKCTVFFGPR